METEWEQYIVAVQSFIPGVEIAFCHGKGVAQVEQAVHVCVGEGLEEFGFFVGLNCEILVSVPNVSGSALQADEFVPSDCAGLFLLFHDKSAK